MKLRDHQTYILTSKKGFICLWASPHKSADSDQSEFELVSPIKIASTLVTIDNIFYKNKKHNKTKNK